MKYRLRRANQNNTTLIITIPKWIVEKLELKEKDIVKFDTQGKKIIITKEEM